MSGSQKFAIFLGVFSLVMLAVSILMFVHGPEVDAKSTEVARTPIIEEPIPADPIAALRAEAEARGIRWKIFCTAYYESDPEEFMVIASTVAAPNGEPAVYIEDGAKPLWLENKFPSQEAAALWLLRAMKGSPNWQPRHRDERKRRTEECPTIRG